MKLLSKIKKCSIAIGIFMISIPKKIFGTSINNNMMYDEVQPLYGVKIPIEEPINKNKFEMPDTKFLILILLPIIFIIGCITYYKKSKSPSKAKILRIIILGVLMVTMLFL